MKSYIPFGVAASFSLAAGLALTACSSPGDSAADPAASEQNLSIDDNIADEAAIADEDSDTAVSVVDTPSASSATTTEDSSTLTAVDTIDTVISAGSGVTRVRHGDGWAWMRDGHIVRTASRDGSEVAYYRNGSDSPFYVQQSERGYAYSGGEPTRSFDRDGKASTPDATTRREAEAARDWASQEHASASTAVTRARQNNGSDRPTASPSPTSRAQSPNTPGDQRSDASPTPRQTQTPTQTNSQSREQAKTEDERQPSRRVTPSPTPTPTQGRASTHDWPDSSESPQPRR